MVQPARIPLALNAASVEAKSCLRTVMPPRDGYTLYMDTQGLDFVRILGENLTLSTALSCIYFTLELSDWCHSRQCEPSQVLLLRTLWQPLARSIIQCLGQMPFLMLLSDSLTSHPDRHSTLVHGHYFRTRSLREY